MHIPIKRAVERVPGGMMIVPLFAGAVIATAWPAGLATAAVPAIVADANPSYAKAAEHATILIAASVVVTAIVTPLVTAWWAARVAKRKDDEPTVEPSAAATVRGS